ncbi:hypothetical protein HJG60_011168 [Phyllostomus discolor]|uniref:Uncharacterized protein n=1 Tax=Phyllostomus discolor TaxID=89673 RepID=A0A834E563_9CHIR|nr:hypothetical protein HJG60_011168 [Phyllostomus discolor]
MSRGGPHQVKRGQHGLRQAAVGIQAVGLHIVKMDFLEVADLLLGQQGGVGVLLGTHLVVCKEGVEQAAFIVLEIEARHDAAVAPALWGPGAPQQICCAGAEPCWRAASVLSVVKIPNYVPIGG